MVKTIKICMWATMIALCVGLSSCSKDDEVGDDSFVGKWEAVEEFLWENNKWESEYKFSAGECVWTFNETHVSIKDNNDLFNGQTVSYSYNSTTKELKLAGTVVHNVSRLTTTEFDIEFTAGAYKQKTTFKKI